MNVFVVSVLYFHYTLSDLFLMCGILYGLSDSRMKSTDIAEFARGPRY